MPLARNNRRWRIIAAATVVAILSLGAAPSAFAQMLNPTKPSEPNKKTQFEGYATWYPVPRSSRTKSRAAPGELTASHPRLPFGTKVRVTHLGNHKSVVVCIIDRLAGKRDSAIDLSKEAAQELGMLSEGRARVRLEILSEELETSPKW